MCTPSQSTGGVDVVDVRALFCSVKSTATSPKSARRVVRRNTAESVPLDDVAFGFAVSGLPVHGALPVENSEPLVSSQSGERTAVGSCGFQYAYSFVTSPGVAGTAAAHSGPRPRRPAVTASTTAVPTPAPANPSDIALAPAGGAGTLRCG